MKNLSKHGNLLHIALGGAICFLAIVVLRSLMYVAVLMLLFNFNCLGLLSFENGRNAIILFMLGTVYLPSGFSGGLYVAYKIKKNPKINLLIPAIIGTIIFAVLQFFTVYKSLSSFNFQNEVIIPLIGNVIGAYLGGYTLNWKTEEEDTY